MKLQKLIVLPALLFTTGVIAQMRPDWSNSFGVTDPNIKGIGIGAWMAPNLPEARLHVNNFLCNSPEETGLSGFLFRTDGSDASDNSWQLYTGTNNSVIEKFRLYVPANSDNTIFNAVTDNATMQLQTGGVTRLFIESNGKNGNQGFIGINNSSPAYNLDVTGDINASGSLNMGSSEEGLKFAVTPATGTTPTIYKIIPSGTHFNGGNNNNSPDPTPNLDCVNGQQMPSAVTAFSQMISVAKNSAPNSSNPTNGNILLGHNGLNAFIETQGTGNVQNNHPGDLFINQMCGRNAYFFSHATPFTSSSYKFVSIDGAFNVRSNVQIGEWSATTFKQLQSKLYVSADAGSAQDGIKVRHGGAGHDGIKIVEYSTEKPFGIFKANSNSYTNDGSEIFSVQASGQTSIVANNTDALLVSDAGNSSQINFKVNSSGKTIIGNLTQVSPGHTNALLTVNGKMVAQSCYITLDNWADKVFEKDYKLPDLYDVEKYYVQNKHLPEIPSEKEVVSNGVNVGEMNKLLLQKVEELTLYVVQLRKEMDAMKSSGK